MRLVMTATTMMLRRLILPVTIRASIIAVAASDSSDNMASFTQYGATSVDLAAPGVGIWSSVAGSDTSYASFNGTSMATPHVAGAAALLCAQYPSLTVAQLKSSLMQSVDILPQWTGKVVSNGRLNLARAMVPSPNLTVSSVTAQRRQWQWQH